MLHGAPRKMCHGIYICTCVYTLRSQLTVRGSNGLKETHSVWEREGGARLRTETAQPTQKPKQILSDSDVVAHQSGHQHEYLYTYTTIYIVCTTYTHHKLSPKAPISCGEFKDLLV